MAKNQIEELEEKMRAGGDGMAALPPITHNLPDSTIQEEIEAVKDAYMESLTKKKKYQSAHALYRKKLKDAKARGCNVKAIVNYLKQMDEDPAEVSAELDDMARYMRIMGMPIGVQPDLFTPDNKPVRGQPSPRVQGENAKAGRRGKNKNPYEIGSFEYDEWMAGYIAGRP